MNRAASDAWLACACDALSSPVRRAVLQRLFQLEPAGIDMRGLAVSLDLAPHAASAHLRTLADAGLACVTVTHAVTVYRPCVAATAALFGAILGTAQAAPRCLENALPCDTHVMP